MPSGVFFKRQKTHVFLLCCVLLLFFFFLLNESLIYSVFFLDEAVTALMAVKIKLKDESNVMNGWDINSVDPCTWNMVACSPEGYVVSL